MSQNCVCVSLWSWVLLPHPQVSLTQNCQPPRRSGRAAQMQTIFIALLFFPFFVGALSIVAYSCWRYGDVIFKPGSSWPVSYTGWVLFVHLVLVLQPDPLRDVWSFSRTKQYLQCGWSLDRWYKYDPWFSVGCVDLPSCHPKWNLLLFYHTHCDVSVQVLPCVHAVCASGSLKLHTLFWAKWYCWIILVHGVHAPTIFNDDAKCEHSAVSLV